MISLKYNRTMHLPWSPGKGSDDKVAPSVEGLLNQPIVISEKLDGSNASLEREGCFARTHAHAPTHVSFDWLKAFHSSVSHKIPKNIQIFGENMYAVHSITYYTLPSYFLVFGVRDLSTNNWSSWEETELWASEIGMPTVPILHRDIIRSEQVMQELTSSIACCSSIYGEEREGIVVRIAGSFSDEDFSKCVAKYVRENHVNTDNDHWKHQEVIRNKLKI